MAQGCRQLLSRAWRPSCGKVALTQSTVHWRERGLMVGFRTRYSVAGSPHTRRSARLLWLASYAWSTAEHRVAARQLAPVHVEGRAFRIAPHRQRKVELQGGPPEVEVDVGVGVLVAVAVCVDEAVAVGVVVVVGGGDGLAVVVAEAVDVGV